MLKTRLSLFASMSDDERATATRSMIAALWKLDPEGRSRVTYTRLESLAEDFAATRKKLIGTHMMVLMGLPREQILTDFNALATAMGRCHDSCRTADVGSMKELVAEMPGDKRSMMVQILPTEIRKMLMG
jgi:hypothetical protein